MQLLYIVYLSTTQHGDTSATANISVAFTFRMAAVHWLPFLGAKYQSYIGNMSSIDNKP